MESESSMLEECLACPQTSPVLLPSYLLSLAFPSFHIFHIFRIKNWFDFVLMPFFGCLHGLLQVLPFALSVLVVRSSFTECLHGLWTWLCKTRWDCPKAGICNWCIQLAIPWTTQKLHWRTALAGELSFGWVNLLNRGKLLNRTVSLSASLSHWVNRPPAFRLFWHVKALRTLAIDPGNQAASMLELQNLTQKSPSLWSFAMTSWLVPASLCWRPLQRSLLQGNIWLQSAAAQRKLGHRCQQVGWHLPHNSKCSAFNEHTLLQNWLFIHPL